MTRLARKCWGSPSDHLIGLSGGDPRQSSVPLMPTRQGKGAEQEAGQGVVCRDLRHDSRGPLVPWPASSEPQTWGEAQTELGLALEHRPERLALR